MLVIGRNVKEVEITRDSDIPSSESRILVEPKEIYSSSMPGKEFLGLTINSVNLTLSLPQNKVMKVQNMCKEMHKKNHTSILELTKLLGLLLSTIQAVIPARLQIRNLQQMEIQALRLRKLFQDDVYLTALAKEKLIWSVENLAGTNGKASVQNCLN